MACAEKMRWMAILLTKTSVLVESLIPLHPSTSSSVCYLSTIPFLAVVISLHPANAFLSLLVFGFGMLTPSLLFVLLGKASIRAFTSCGNQMNTLSKGMNWVLATSGFYLMVSIYTVSLVDLAVASVVFFAQLFFVAKMYPTSSPRPFLVASAFLIATCCILFAQSIW